MEWTINMKTTDIGYINKNNQKIWDIEAYPKHILAQKPMKWSV